MHRILIGLLLALGLLAFGPPAWAQEADQSHGRNVLLRALARYSETEVRNLEREQRNIFYGQDSESPTMELHWRSLVDFENHRLLNEDYAGGRVVKRTVYTDGRAHVLDFATNSVSELADDEHQFASILARDVTWPARVLPRAVYEGRQRYFDLVEGEQFAVPGDADKFLFNSSGRLIARVTPSTSGGAPTDIRILEDERLVGGFWFPFLIRGYHVEGGEVALVQEVRVLELKVNQDLSYARFALRPD